jgi:hypothetical protein
MKIITQTVCFAAALFLEYNEKAVGSKLRRPSASQLYKATF